MIFTVNGTRRTVSAHPLKRLLDVLREDCGLTGTKEGCGEGECGACTVLVDGVAVNSCLVPVAQVDGARLLTIEGLNGRHPLQAAFVKHGGAQCGICTPGMIMAAIALGPKPTLDEMRVGLAGNLCRCTGYSAIYRSIASGARPEVESLRWRPRFLLRVDGASGARPEVESLRSRPRSSARGGGAPRAIKRSRR